MSVATRCPGSRYKRNRGALAFAVGGKQVFAARVNLPAIAMPERSYMRSSLAEMGDEITDGLSEAVVGAMD